MRVDYNNLTRKSSIISSLKIKLKKTKDRVGPRIKVDLRFFFY